MKKRLAALGLLMSLAATGAVADSQHYATAPTKHEAKRLATASARASAKDLSQCYHPARQVRECLPVDGGFRCRAETSDNARTCRRAGWVNEYAATAKDPGGVYYFAWYRGATYGSSMFDSGLGSRGPYRWWATEASAPPPPPPFPSN